MIWSRRRSGDAAGDPAGGSLPRLWARPAGRLVRAGAVAVVVAVAVAWWVRADNQAPAAGSTPPAGAAARPAAVQDLGELASAMGCRATVTGENTGYRQAVCRTPANRYTLTTFTSTKGQQDWLSEALPYGGAYLVGARWVVNANTAAGLPELAARIGGTIVDKTQEHHS